MPVMEVIAVTFDSNMAVMRQFDEITVIVLFIIGFRKAYNILNWKSQRKLSTGRCVRIWKYRTEKDLQL
jgi:hypothetical protein